MGLTPGKSGTPAPRTLEEAVTRLLREMDEESRRIVRETAEDDLIRFHHGWGQGLRNAWLWHNPELVESCGVDHPDGASGVIIREVWKRLRIGIGERPTGP